jgi:hypothetical protein
MSRDDSVRKVTLQQTGLCVLTGMYLSSGPHRLTTGSSTTVARRTASLTDLNSLTFYVYDSLRSERSGDRIPVGNKTFRSRSDRPWGPPSLLYNWDRVSFRGVKRPRRDVNHPHLSSKGKAFPLQAWAGPWGSGRLRLPDFLDFRPYESGKVVTLTHRPSLPQEYPGTHF